MEYVVAYMLMVTMVFENPITGNTTEIPVNTMYQSPEACSEGIAREATRHASILRRFKGFTEYVQGEPYPNVKKLCHGHSIKKPDWWLKEMPKRG